MASLCCKSVVQKRRLGVSSVLCSKQIDNVTNWTDGETVYAIMLVFEQQKGTIIALTKLHHLR